MKKLLFSTAGLLLLACFFVSFKSIHSIHPQAATINATLNGVTKADALTLIQNFNDNYQNDVASVKSVSAWFSVDEITKIYNLLVTEERTKGADGVRLYFGSDKPRTGTKLNVEILFVTTKPQLTGGDPQKSAHGDYYDHDGSNTFLNIKTGSSTCNQARAVMYQGGGFYDPNPPSMGTCHAPSSHYLRGNIAYKWVQARSDDNNSTGDKSAYNTKSVWYSMCFIKSLLDATIKNHFSGVRVYAGKGEVDTVHHIFRDLFILVPTKAVGPKHLDYYNCLEDLANGNFCNEAVHFIPRLKFYHGVTFQGPVDGGAYDEGELCPDVCN